MTKKDQHHNRHYVWWIAILLMGSILPTTDALSYSKPPVVCDESQDWDLDNDTQQKLSVHYSYYLGKWKRLPNFSKLTPVRTGFGSAINLDDRPRDYYFGAVFVGQLKIDTAGDYSFYTTSDNGSKLIINGQPVVNNDGAHLSKTENGTIFLTAGYHQIRVEFFQRKGCKNLAVHYQGADTDHSKQILRPSTLGSEAEPTQFHYAYYSGRWTHLPNFSKLTPAHSGYAPAINLDNRPEEMDENFGAVFVGQLKIDNAGDYRFYVTSEGGSRLIINGRPVLNNDGTHAIKTENGTVSLTAGYYQIRVEFFQRKRGKLDIQYKRILGNSAIELEKTTQPEETNIAPGPQLNVGDLVNWLFRVTNTGDTELTNIVITDKLIQPEVLPTTTVCEIATLAIGKTQTCEISTRVIEGQYESRSTATAEGPGNTLIKDEDRSHYNGIVVNSLAALPSAAPASGSAPLTVTFTPNATTSNAIVRYEWDFEGDGHYDRTETVGRDQTYTYSALGNYNATLRVTDNQGEQATDTVIISVNNRAPVVSVDLIPSNGQVPLKVDFIATATDEDGIAQFEWDFEGDGIIDQTTTTGAISHIYRTEGFFQARVKVTDNRGAFTLLTIPTLEVNALPTGSPTVTLTASPSKGDSPLQVKLSAVATVPDGTGINRYEWDVDGDGTYEQTTDNSYLQTTYSGIGTFYPRVRIANSANQYAEDTTKVFVQQYLSLSLSTDTIDPHNSETTSITTALSGDTEVSLVIEDRTGQPVRTLVPYTRRTKGNYTDEWDGTDDAGNMVSEGDYRAILLYRIDAIERRFDLASTTGGQQSNPRRSLIPSNFSPLANDPLDITFTLDRASEVTAFMGLFNINTRLVTFMQRRPLGRGSHVVTWNGESADGQLVEAPSGEKFLFGLFAYSLPDNAIYVRSGVHVSSISATPSIFQPSQLTAEGSPNLSRIALELNRGGTVKLTINDTDSGATVASFTHTGLTAGSNSLSWDGKDNNGNYVAPGTYRLGATGVDSTGHQTLTVYALQRVLH